MEPTRPRHPKWASLSDPAYRFGDALVCWGAEYETDFVPEPVLEQLAGGKARAKRLARELEDCGRPHGREGILEREAGGWRIHDAPQYWPPDKRPPSDPPASPAKPERPRSAALADAGRKGAAKRWGKRQLGHGGDGQTDSQGHARGHAGDSQTDSPGHGQANGLGHPEAIGSRAETLASSEKNGDGYGKSAGQPAKDLTGIRAREHGQAIAKDGQSDGPSKPRAGGRADPFAQSFEGKVSLSTWQPTASLHAYALAEGLSENQFLDCLTDMREKVRKKVADAAYYESQLRRFVDARAERLREKTAHAKAVGAEVKPEREIDREGEVCELAEDERPRLPPPLRFKAWDVDPTTRRFKNGRDSEGARWYLDDERRLRRKPPPPAAQGNGRGEGEPGSGTHRTAANGRGNEGAA
jgi:hypothetical protein